MSRLPVSIWVCTRQNILEEEWRVKLNVGQEWIKASFMDGNTEIWFKNEGEYKGQITEQQFIKSPIAKVLSKGHKETYTQTSVARVDGTQKNITIQYALNGEVYHWSETTTYDTVSKQRFVFDLYQYFF